MDACFICTDIPIDDVLGVKQTAGIPSYNETKPNKNQHPEMKSPS